MINDNAYNYGWIRLVILQWHTFQGIDSSISAGSLKIRNSFLKSSLAMFVCLWVMPKWRTAILAEGAFLLGKSAGTSGKWHCSRMDALPARIAESDSAALHSEPTILCGFDPQRRVRDKQHGPHGGSFPSANPNGDSPRAARTSSRAMSGINYAKLY